MTRSLRRGMTRASAERGTGAQREVRSSPLRASGPKCCIRTVSWCREILHRLNLGTRGSDDITQARHGRQERSPSLLMTIREKLNVMTIALSRHELPRGRDESRFPRPSSPFFGSGAATGC